MKLTKAPSVKDVPFSGIPVLVCKKVRGWTRLRAESLVYNLVEYPNPPGDSRNAGVHRLQKVALNNSAVSQMLQYIQFAQKSAFFFQL